MSLSDIYNPKEGYDSIDYLISGNSMSGLSKDTIQFPKSTPHCGS
jgi:hypothetical protein